MYLIITTLIGVACLFLVRRLIAHGKGTAPLPPGPRPLPLVGNVRDLPAPDSPDWLHWFKHKDLYGPISSVSIFGQEMIIINEASFAVDLLEKRSAVHSDRPKMPFAQLAGWGDGLVLLEYSKRFHAYRKNLHREIGTSASIARFNRAQEVEVRRFLLRLIDSPRDLVPHVRKLVAALILKITYGYGTDPHGHDPLVDLADQAIEQFSLSARPGTWIVDFAPFLSRLPVWFPGAGFQRTAQVFRKQTRSLAEIPFSFVRHQMAQSDFEPSYVSNMLEETPVVEGSAEESVIKWSAGSLYGGGADTTVSAMSTFFLAMAMFPDVQRKAQEEIDRVIDGDRLPTSSDRDQLPYVNAVVNEVLRWHPVAPMGIPHRAMEDDICNGYLIPKGAIILANIWAFCHDPKEYADPMVFNPERFLGENPERDPHFVSFGYGRRVCPGRALADASLYLTVAQSLATLRISKAVRDGKEVALHSVFLPGVISHPAPFEVNIKPRSGKYESMIRSVEQEHPWEEGHAEIIRGLA